MNLLNKKKFIVFLVVFIFAFLGCAQNFALAQQLDISAKAAVVMCGGSKQVLFEKNMNEKLPMASTTKIMTALITLEEAKKDNKEITINEKMVPVEGSTMGLKVGDKLTLYALAQGMLLISGNDAATSAAVAISGSSEEFAKKMNLKAKEIGMENTNFVTPSGLDDENHYSTAYDMAKLASFAMNNPDFEKITSSKSMNVEYSNPKKVCEFRNSNRLLRSYDGCIGVKTGFTKKSGRCLVTCAKRDNKEIICVTLSDPDDWQDHKTLLDYGFENCKSIILDENALPKVQVVGGITDEIKVGLNDKKQITVDKNFNTCEIKTNINIPEFIYAPIKKGETVGYIEYKINDQKTIKSDIIALEDVKQNKTHEKFSRLKRFLKGNKT